MDVSIAVSLLRGQMGAVVERAVSGAVETVLSEMLRAVGVKFEELKAELLRAKREAALLQREAAQREKESDGVRAKLRYAELKLKYYRQGVEEELQHRAALAHMQTAPHCTSSHRGDAELLQSEWEMSERHSGQSGDRLFHCDRTLEQLQGQPSEEEAADQVKQEVPWAEVELMCVKEEPQEVTLPLLPPAELLQSHSWATPPLHLTNHSAATRLSAQSSGPALPRPLVRPWSKELRLYEELKLRRRNLSRRRELQETLAPPLLTELVRERREKTRLRVARWRAKRKLQAQAGGGAAPQSEFVISSQHLSAPCEFQGSVYLPLSPSPSSSAPPQPSPSWNEERH